jgi:hypothetical protein
VSSLLASSCAAALAAIISVMEVVGQWRRFIYPRVYGWICARIAAHALAAAISYGLLKLLFKGTDWVQGPITICVAGFCGVAILRSSLSALGSGQETTADNPAVSLRRALGYIDGQILEASTIAESSWMVYKALPSIRQLDFADVCAQTKLYINQTRRLDAKAKKRELTFVEATMSDPDTGDAGKCDVIAYRLLELGARGLVAQMAKQHRKAAGAP